MAKRLGAHQQYATVITALFQRVESSKLRGGIGMRGRIVCRIAGNHEILVLFAEDGYQRRFIVRL